MLVIFRNDFWNFQFGNFRLFRFQIIIQKTKTTTKNALNKVRSSFLGTKKKRDLRKKNIIKKKIIIAKSIQYSLRSESKIFFTFLDIQRQHT